MAQDDSDSDGQAKAGAMPADVRFLKILVAGLAVVMGAGIVALVALMWIRLGAVPALPHLPEAIVLPDGAKADAVTFARNWIVVVTETGEILLFERTGKLRERVQP